MDIVIINRQRTKKISARLLKQIVSALLAELGIEDAELGIRLVASREMARVNQQFLQHEGPTDVITFDYQDSASGMRHSPDRLHGEVFVCVDEAATQAREFATTWQAEVVRYIVHGILHLLGHDDGQTALRRKMKREENRLLRRLEKRFPLAELQARAAGR